MMKTLKNNFSGREQAEPLWKATKELSEKTFAIFGKKKTEQLFLLMSEFTEICRKQIDLSKI